MTGYQWRGLSDAQLEALRAAERESVSPTELLRRAKIAAAKRGRPARNRHSSARAAGEVAEETAPELFLRAPAPPASVQRTEEPTNPRDDCSSLHRGPA